VSGTSLAAVFAELEEHARCLRDQLDDAAPAERLVDLAARGRQAAERADQDEMLAAARVSRLLLDEIAGDARAGLVGDTLKACDACLDRLDRPLTPPSA
jgi:hypothetical protein